ncbi:FixH family protein [Paenibacillus sp. LHD-117]|uniref:FixH family protein n=1 Tax=Paenibacillus sp. LHD-117 TaxID=3071412 RepID=UPI0027E158FE|nr:FixH family protein [Paenibacillus sp. LHD-117]MDQ6419960.1 FixH family protein [Paenibacillus sp. LHD-117]
MMKQSWIQTAAITVYASISLLVSGCTANVPEVDETGLPPHIAVRLNLPPQVERGKESLYSVEILHGGTPVEGAESAEFVVWPEGAPQDAFSVAASETSPGVYSAAITMQEDGLYVVQSRLKADGDQVMPAKRVVIGADAVERLALLQAAQAQGGTAQEAEGGHPH